MSRFIGATGNTPPSYFYRLTRDSTGYLVFTKVDLNADGTAVVINNNTVSRQINPSWQKFFPDIDLKLVLSSGASVYKDFFKHYGLAVKEGIKDEALHAYLQHAFLEMKVENKDLLEAMERDRNA